jgi:hypothetical protein
VARSLINLLTRPLQIFVRTLGFGTPPEREQAAVVSPGQQTAAPGAGRQLLDASADVTSPANRALHRPGEGMVPIPHYDELNAHDAAIAIQTLTSRTDVQATLRHERAGKNRRTVQDVGEKRLTELVEQEARA